MANSADPDQLASSTDLDLHCLQRQFVSGFNRTRVNCYKILMILLSYLCFKNWTLFVRLDKVTKGLYIPQAGANPSSRLDCISS